MSEKATRSNTNEGSHPAGQGEPQRERTRAERNRLFQFLGIGAALLVPALAVATLNIPHTFTSGEVLSATNLNGDFTAVKTEVDALEARMAAVEATGTTLTGVSLPKCQWLYTNCANSSAGSNCEQVCPSGTHPVAGGCDAPFGVGISESFPAVGSGATFPPTPSSPVGYDRWVCQAVNDVIQNAYALCCPLGS